MQSSVQRSLHSVPTLGPIVEGDLSAELKTLFIPNESAQIKLILNIPSKWVPPAYDEDTSPADPINPYNRDFILPQPTVDPWQASPPPASDISPQAAPGPLNLLQLVAGAMEKDDRIVMPRRADGKAGRLFTGMTGKMTSFVKETMLLAQKHNCRLQLQRIIAEDKKAFLDARNCDLKLEFVFVSEKMLGQSTP